MDGQTHKPKEKDFTAGGCKAKMKLFKCPDCSKGFDDVEIAALHLVDAHLWDLYAAKMWISQTTKKVANGQW